MSLVGVGTDIVSVDRISRLLVRHGRRFLNRCFGSREISPGVSGPEPDPQPDPAWVAGRWAAKEAFLKALGGDVRGIPYRDIEVASSFPGSGGLILHGRALEALTLTGGSRLHLAISQEETFALASVLLEN